MQKARMADEQTGISAVGGRDEDGEIVILVTVPNPESIDGMSPGRLEGRASGVLVFVLRELLDTLEMT